MRWEDVVWVVLCSEWVDVGGCSSAGSTAAVPKPHFGAWLRRGTGSITFSKDPKRCARGANDVLEGCLVSFAQQLGKRGCSH